MNDFDKALARYEKEFDDILPMFPLSGKTETEIIKIVNDCIKSKKDVYDMGILNLDESY